MSEIKTFFRTCPACGKRFEIRLKEKKLVEKERIERTEPVRKDYLSNAGSTGLVSGAGIPAPWPGSVVVAESEPTVIDMEEFQYSYKCKHCGHEWLERHVEEHVE